MRTKKTIILFLIFALVMTFSFTGLAYGTTYTNTKGTITPEYGANVRSGAGTTYEVVMALTKGTVVDVTESKKGSDDYTWYKIKYEGKAGWVRSDCISVKNPTKKTTVTTYTNTKGTITAKDGANVRKKAGTSYDIVMTLMKGTVVQVKSSKKVKDYTWYKITYDGKTGWVRGDLMSINNSSQSSSGVKTYTDTVGTVKAKPGANMRKSAGMSYDLVEMLPTGTEVTVNKSKKAKDGYTWYKVTHGSKSGWVRGTLLRIYKKADTSGTQAGMTDAEYTKYLKKQGFPKSYRTLLKKLHKAHPTWVFKAGKTNLDWDYVVNKESANGVSTVNYVYPLYYRSTEPGAYNKSKKKYTSYDSGGWYSASRVLIRHYLDPRNFLTEDGVYQFLIHSFDSDTQSKSGLKKMVKGTFLADAYPKVEGEDTSLKTYVGAIYKAGKVEGVNPYVIASIILQEQGTQGKGGCISGTVKGYRGYFNFFNIGAYRTSSMNAVERGVWYASQSGRYGRPWNTRYKSIKGGANFYASEYVKTNKNTLYFKKWNVMNGEAMVSKYQYMSNTMGAAQEAYQLKKAYEAIGETPLTFVIPVYNNMPSKLCPLPDSSSPTNLKEEEKMLKEQLEEKNERIKKGFKKLVINTEITKTKKDDGTKALKISWDLDTKGYNISYFQIKRSIFRDSDYKVIYTSKKGKIRSYVNAKNLEKGTRYYYKVRAVRILTDYEGNKTKVYTKWSEPASKKY
ncbi:MAG: SH3 domain-containing protein [Firmicutes bacterium]|nr:SH3 domain-containing protein [Bacillota bacterium]